MGERWSLEKEEVRERGKERGIAEAWKAALGALERRACDIFISKQAKQAQHTHGYYYIVPAGSCPDNRRLRHLGVWGC